jgi:hypothetical protein
MVKAAPGHGVRLETQDGTTLREVRNIKYRNLLASIVHFPLQVRVHFPVILLDGIALRKPGQEKIKLKPCSNYTFA